MAKRIPRTSPQTSFPSLLLYRDDIQDIIDVLQESNPAEDHVEISDAQYAYDSIDDLCKTTGNVVRDLFISEAEYGIWIRISREYRTCLIRPDELSPEGEQTYNKVRQILNEAKRHPLESFAQHLPRPDFLFAAMFLAALAASFMPLPYSMVFGTVGIFFLGLSVFVNCFTSERGKRGSRTKIYLQHRHKVEGKWRKKIMETAAKSATQYIVVAVLTAVVSILSTVGGMLWLQSRNQSVDEEPNQPETRQTAPKQP